jgi:hypothetical protein
MVRNCPRVTEKATDKIVWRKWAGKEARKIGWGIFFTQHQTRFLWP